VCAAEPNTLGAWLLSHAPKPGIDSQAFVCYRGIFRTTGAALRRRARHEYKDMLRQLLRCSNGEANHFVERAALYLFGSV